MARLSDRYVLQMVDNNAILIDEHRGSEQPVPLRISSIATLLDDNDAEHGMFVGDTLLPPEIVPRFVFYLGYFWRSVE